VSDRVTAVPAPYLAKVRRGERPTPEEGLDFLRAWHAAHPGSTARSVSERRFADGRSSYDLLASCVAAGAEASVLDLACGDGLLTSLLADRMEKGRASWASTRARTISCSPARASVLPG